MPVYLDKTQANPYLSTSPLRPMLLAHHWLRMLRGAILLGSLFTTPTASAQELLLDINTSAVGSRPTSIFNHNGLVLFEAYHPLYGSEPWISNGLPSGTSLLAELTSGTGDQKTLAVFGSVGDKIVFSSGHGTKLWSTDGGPPALLFDRSESTSLFVFSPVAQLPSGLLISVRPPSGGIELRTIDATPEGGRVLYQGRSIHPLFTQDGVLFFSGDSGLWRTDGTADGTDLVLAGATLERQAGFIDSLFVFIEWDEENGDEIWTADLGAGTMTRQSQLGPGSPYESIWELTIVEDRAFFNALGEAVGCELFSTDGTTEGTVLVKDIYPGPEHSNPWDMTPLNGGVAFTASSELGRELWFSDGSPEGTVLLADIGPGSESGSPHPLVTVDGTLFFSADDGIHGRELWATDGTVGNTRMVLDFNPGPGGSDPSHASLRAGGFYLQATLPDTGSELWFYEVASESVNLVADIAQGYTASSSPSTPLPTGAWSLFLANGELWRTDGSTEGTSMVTDQLPGPVSSAIEVSGTAYLTVKAAGGDRQVWATDGTALGTQLILAGLGRVDEMVPADDHFYFLASIDGNTTERNTPLVWVSDGTAEGTRQVPGGNSPPGKWPREALAVGADLFFWSERDEHWWVTDGTDSRPVQPVPAAGFPRETIAVDSLLFFTTNDGVWRSNGTSSGTFEVSRGGSGFGEVRGRLLFTCATVLSGEELCASDGTPEGTGLLANLNQGSLASNPRSFAEVGERTYFLADQRSTGTALWWTDGTAAGTEMVEDLRAGNGVFNGNLFGEIDGQLFFTIDSEATGSELWVSDGTRTTPLVDLIPGPISSIPVRVGNSILFAADVSPFGRELWSLPTTLVGLEPGPASSPGEITLGTPYPNPSSSIAWLPVAGLLGANLKVTAFDLLGRQIAILHRGLLAVPTLRIAVKGWPAGSYFIRLESGGRIDHSVLVVAR
jgi:ELWxxDGT repeat protein